MDILLAQAYLGPREVLGICWLVEANLHGHLHHEPAEHESGISRSAVCGERPCAEQTEGFNYMMGRLRFHHRLPDQVGQWLFQADEQARIGLVVSCSYADDGP